MHRKMQNAILVYDDSIILLHNPGLILFISVVSENRNKKAYKKTLNSIEVRVFKVKILTTYFKLYS